MQYLKRSLFESPFASTAKVVGRIKQPEQCSGLLLQRGWLGGVGAEVVTRQVGKTKFIIAGKFPGQFQFNIYRQLLRCGYKFGGRRFFKLEQGIHGLDLDAFARVQLDLQRTVGLKQYAASQMLAGFFKQYEQNERLFMMKDKCNQVAKFKNSKISGRCWSKSLSAWSLPSTSLTLAPR